MVRILNTVMSRKRGIIFLLLLVSLAVLANEKLKAKLERALSKYSLSTRDETKDEYLNKVLIRAIRAGNFIATKNIIRLGGKINVPYGQSTHMSPLVVAIEEGRYRIFRYLLKIGADTNLVLYQKRDLVMKAAESGQLKMLKYLIIKKRMRYKNLDQNGRSAFAIAALNGRLRVTQYLHRLGGDTNEADLYGWSILAQTAFMEKASVVEFLVLKGARKDHALLLLKSYSNRFGYGDERHIAAIRAMTLIDPSHDKIEKNAIVLKVSDYRADLEPVKIYCACNLDEVKQLYTAHAKRRNSKLCKVGRITSTERWNCHEFRDLRNHCEKKGPDGRYKTHRMVPICSNSQLKAWGCNTSFYCV